MMSTLLNIAGKIDPKPVAVFEVVSRVIAGLDMRYVVVGATARKLVLHYGHGATVQRATHDVDFAIKVPGWAAFEAL
jgi:predicted nucleotidyltransferase